PSLDCSFIKLSILDNAFCRVDQYPILLFSVRYCVSRNLYRILFITPISTPVPFCPAPPGIILAAFGKEGVVLKSTRCLEYPSVLTFEILCPVVYKAPCCAYRARFDISKPLKVLIVVSLILWNQLSN